MSEEKCESCGRAVPYDEIEYGWCPECIDEVTHDTDLILEYICDYRNNYGGNNYKHDFFVNYCHNANDTEFSSTLTLVCKKHFLYIDELSQQTGLTVQNTRTALKKLISTGEIASKLFSHFSKSELFTLLSISFSAASVLSTISTFVVPYVL